MRKPCFVIVIDYAPSLGMFCVIHVCVDISLLRLVLVGGGGYIICIYSVCIVLDTLNTYQLPHKCSGAKKKK